MPRITRLFAGLILPLLATSGTFPSAARAQQAPDDRCTGTLCDFYYGSSKPAPAAPSTTASAPTPVTVPGAGYLGNLFSGSPSTPATPGAAAPAAPSRVQVQGGGLVGMATGAPAERCSGTLCDLYYGGPPPERPEQPAEQQAAQAGTDAAEQPVVDEAPPSPRRRAIPPPAEPQRCAAPANDPWRCYR